MSILCRLGFHRLSDWSYRDPHDPSEGKERRCYRGCGYEKRRPA